MDVYSLSRNYFDWCFENPEKVTPNHTALYFFIIEHSNRLGWKEKFGLPMEMAKDAIGIKNYRTYSKAFNDLVDFGFIKVIEKSKNQYSANIIAIVKNTKAHTKALSKAMQKHSQKQYTGIVGVDIPITYIPNTNLQEETSFPSEEEFVKYGMTILKSSDFDFPLRAKYQSWSEAKWKDGNNKAIKNWKTKLQNTIPHMKPFNPTKKETTVTYAKLD